ncbi:MAG: BTAD domain-containing putative transcriptional regulator [Mycobacterium sp.]
MRYLLLGSMLVADDTHSLRLGGFRQRAVLAALLLSPDRVVDVDTLTEQVWDGSPPPKPIASLRAYIANLRRILAYDQRTDRLVTDGHGYRLQLGPDQLDTRIFEAQVEQGRRLLSAGNASGAGSVLAEALDLWRGAPLSEFRDLSFCHHEIHRLEALRADAVGARYEADLMQGRSAELIDGLEQEVAANPLREQLWAQLMIAMYRAGRRADALAAYRRLRAVLDDELGVRPGAQLDRLATEIRNESATLDWTPLAARTVVTSTATRQLYGRDRELARVRELLTAAADGHGSVAVVVGESGVGKTALATEVTHLAKGLGMISVWAGHAGGVRTPPSWAWAQVLRGLADHNGRPSTDNTANAAPDVNAGDETFPAPVVFANPDAVATAVVRMAGRRPTVIVLDDLHRADKTTRDVLELLATFVTGMPLLILATWQDGGMDRPLREREFDRLLSRCEVTLLRLRGITRDATAKLIENVSGVTPTCDFAGSVAARTGGNPFFIRELTRLLHDNGRLDDATRAIAGEDVPEAVSGVIRYRMAGLPRATRSALLVAALLGTEFRLTVAADALRSTPTRVAQDLEPARRVGLVANSDPDRFKFSHGLVRDAVAAQVGGLKRAQIHADIARAYAASDSAAVEDSFAGGGHAWQAGSELDTEMALRLLDRARAAAWQRSAYREVAGLSVQGLEVCTRLKPGDVRREREADLWLQLLSVQALTKGQNSKEVRDALSRLSRIGSRTGQFTLEAAFRCLEASGSGRYHEAAILADGLIAVYADADDPIAGSAGYYLRGLVEFFRGALDKSTEAIETLTEHLPTVEWQRHGHLAAFDVRGYGVAAWTSAVRGEKAAVDAWVQRGIALAEARNDLFGRAIVRISALQARAIMGHSAGTAALAREVYDELTELGINQLATSARVIEHWSNAMGPGGYDTADAVREAIDKHTEDGTRIFLPMYYLLLADTEMAQGRSGAASAALDCAESIAAATGERVWDEQRAARRLRLRAAASSRRDGGLLVDDIGGLAENVGLRLT